MSIKLQFIACSLTQLNADKYDVKLIESFEYLNRL
jgi:hypothetical protein